MKIIDVGALFFFGYGWYPSEIMADYMGKSIINGIYKIISWINKTSWLIEDYNYMAFLSHQHAIQRNRCGSEFLLWDTGFIDEGVITDILPAEL